MSWRKSLNPSEKVVHPQTFLYLINRKQTWQKTLQTRNPSKPICSQSPRRDSYWKPPQITGIPETLPKKKNPFSKLSSTAKNYWPKLHSRLTLPPYCQIEKTTYEIYFSRLQILPSRLPRIEYLSLFQLPNYKSVQNSLPTPLTSKSSPNLSTTERFCCSWPYDLSDFSKPHTWTQ